jgi:hypothetical protein
MGMYGPHGGGINPPGPEQGPPQYDPTQAVPAWLGGAEAFQLPTDRPRTPLESAVFRLMAQHPDEVTYSPPETTPSVRYPARHTLHIDTERGNVAARVLSDYGEYRGIVLFGEPIERRLGRLGTVSLLPDGEVTARKFVSKPQGLYEKIIDLDHSWHRLVPPRLRTANFLAALLRDGLPSLPPVR